MTILNKVTYLFILSVLFVEYLLWINHPKSSEAIGLIAILVSVVIELSKLEAN